MFNHRHNGDKHLLGAMAKQELVQDSFAENVPSVATSVKQQLWCILDGDEAVIRSVGSDDACSNHVNLVWMHYLNGVDKVLVSGLRTEVDRTGGEDSTLLHFSCN